MQEGAKQKQFKHDEDVWYEAFARKDSRFDGRFFVGVASTGIYCRPVCRAKLPKRENCAFYSNAAEAENAGFRPCMLCRPELAPGSPDVPVDATALLVKRASGLIEKNCIHGEGISEAAKRLSCSDRHLRRAFMDKLSVTPVRYLQTCRLLLAKNLLTDTNLSIINVAMAAGFNSLRRFNDVFKTRYRIVPTSFRKSLLNEKARTDNIRVSLGYRPPYQWKQLLNFLESRIIPGVEAVINAEYCRTVRLFTKEGRQLSGVIKVGHKPQNNTLSVTVDEALLPVMPQILTKIKHMFDLYCDPEAVYRALKSMNKIKGELCVLGTRLPGCFDPFEMSIRAVLGQQISIKAAHTLAARMVQAFGTPLKTQMPELTHLFPLPKDVLSLEGGICGHLGPLGITAVRAKTILGLAQAFENGDLDFNLCVEPEAELKKLMKISGIGNWTANYIAMRAMGCYDAFPDTDYGVKKALAPRNAREILALAETWRPWRSYATINLWNSL